MLRPYYLARTKAQVAPHLKPIEYAGTHPPGNPDGPVGVYLDMVTESGMPTRQGKAYKQMEEMGLATTCLVGAGLQSTACSRCLTCSLSPYSAYGPGARIVILSALSRRKPDWILDFLDERWRSLDWRVVIASRPPSSSQVLPRIVASWLACRHDHRRNKAIDDDSMARDLFTRDGLRVCTTHMFCGR